MFNLEKSIKEWLKSFRKHKYFNDGAIHEMELHLRDHMDDLVSEGQSEQKAFEEAIIEFGEIPKMAQEEFYIIRTKTTIMSIIRTTLLKNYFKTSFRSLLKHPLNSFINIFGLSVAIGICLVVYAFVERDLSIDQFHKNKNSVYLVTFFTDQNGNLEQYGTTPTPLGKMLKEDFSQIKKICRVKDNNVVLKYENKVFHEKVRYVDPEFLQMFTFPLKWGLSNSLADMNSIVLSEIMSIKYFGEENPLGESILMKFDGNRSKTFTVTGVAEAIPKSHAIEFDFLIKIENLKISNPEYDFSDWRGFVDATLIQVDAPSDVEMIENEMGEYITLQNKVQKNKTISSFSFEPLATLHAKSRHIKNDISFGMREEGWIFLSILAVFILALACFNYINIAIVSASKRLKEIGIRKVIGANKKLIIIQFLIENIFITFFTLILGIILSINVFIPWFNDLFGESFELSLIDKNLWVFLISILLFTGIASGLYPALYISKFEVIKIFKGSVQFGKKNMLTKVLLCGQLILACITISSGIYLTQNNIYQASRSWGYNPSQVVYAEVPDLASYNQLNESMDQNPNILSKSGSNHHLGMSISTSVVHLPNDQYDVNQLSVDANYFETMGFQLLEGRVFKDNYGSDKRNIVINNTLAKKTGLKEPIGQIFKIDSIRYEVIGVVKDFHLRDFDTKVLPTIFNVAHKEDYKYLSMKVRKGSEKETVDKLQSEWSVLFPESPFLGGHQEDIFNSYFDYLDSGAQFMRAFGFIGILLATLGLYGLVTLNVSGRIREFSIRKVLGAKLKNIALSIINQYLVLVVIAICTGAPLSYLFVQGILDTFFEYHMPMNYAGVVIASIILILVLLITLYTLIQKVSKSNPVEGLKIE